MTRRATPWTALRAVFLLLLTLFALLPMAWMLLTSVKSQFAASQYPPQWWPASATFDEYARLLSPSGEVGQDFLRYIINSVTVSTASTAVGVILALPAAYAFSRFRFPGRKSLFYAVLLRNMFPAIIFLIPIFALMRWLRLVNTEWSLILSYLTFGLPLSIWLLKGFYDNIPPQLEQAARIDGATRFGAFIRIALPLSSPGIVAAATYSFVLAWNEYVYALTFLNDKDKLTLPVGLQRFFTEYATDWPGLMAGSCITCVPMVLLFLALQRFLVRALADGSVKPWD